jgi:NAD(P)-dependent dehydrogenase (short-subunit alcohol dehydrogenase family)
MSVQKARVITIARIDDLPEEDWDKVKAVSTKGVFLCCQVAIARIRKHGDGGRLINTASDQARQGFIFTPHYAASKFGVIGITQSLTREVAKEGITVNAFCPGIIETDMWAYNDRAWGKLLANYGPGELMAEWVKNVPMGRAGGAKTSLGLLRFWPDRTPLISRAKRSTSMGVDHVLRDCCRISLNVLSLSPPGHAMLTAFRPILSVRSLITSAISREVWPFYLAAVDGRG